MAHGGRWARRTCLYQDVHVTVGPVTPLNDDMLAVAAPFMDIGRGLKKPLRCAEALYEHFIRHCNPLDGADLDFLDDDEDEFPFDALVLRTARFTPWRRNGLRRASFQSQTPMLLQLIRSEAYVGPRAGDAQRELPRASNGEGAPRCSLRPHSSPFSLTPSIGGRAQESARRVKAWTASPGS